MPDEKPFYEDKERGVRFVNNPNDDVDAYDVYIGPDHFYISGRCIHDLASTVSTTEDTTKKLRNLNSTIHLILEQIIFLQTKCTSIYCK